MTATLRPATTETGDDHHEDEADVQFATLLDLLGDEYACTLLCALADGPATAGELVDRTEMSRPTVYRRLDTLTDAGIVATLSGDSRQKTAYRLVVDCVEFQLHPDGVEGAIRPTDADD